MSPNEAKVSSVKRTMILALVPDCPESHYNVMQILDSLDLQKMKFTYAVDVKMGMLKPSKG